ncbi:MAG: rhiA [Candidatus Eremiobacteraeota bacterium]|nr:rhiA [Candidatus Eremiobacteraeota bacterium]
MARLFRVNFFNNGPNPGSVMLFQRNPDGNPTALSLAWFTKYNYPQTRVSFEWTDDLCFVWSDTGPLVPGIVAEASQVIPADVEQRNQITLKYDRAFTFVDSRQSGHAGVLSIIGDVTIPPGMASAGIGMSGQPTFLMPAAPNTIYEFVPHTQYWIAFGTYASSQVLDVTALGDAAQIGFPDGISAMDATLNPEGTWKIAPTHLAAEV